MSALSLNKSSRIIYYGVIIRVYTCKQVTVKENVTTETTLSPHVTERKKYFLPLCIFTKISTSTTLLSYHDFIFSRVKQTSKFRENFFCQTIFYPNFSFCSDQIVIHKQVLIIDHIPVILETSYCFPRVRTLDWTIYQRV